MPVTTGLKAKAAIDVDVAVIGAGIGGLAAANALKHAGIDAHVFERAHELRDIGGAIVIREPSLTLFESWKIATSFHAEAVRVDVIEMHDSHGIAKKTQSADLANDGWAYSIHRADVHKMLIDGVRPGNVHLGMDCTGVNNGSDRSVVTFAGASNVRAKVVIGADGIKSVIRRLISDDEPIFQRLVVFRGIAPARALPHGLPNDRLYTWGDEPPMMTLLPLRGGREVAIDRIMSRDEPPRDLWTSEVPTDEVLKFFDGFDRALLDMIRAGTQPIRANPVYDREPLERWSVGRTTLLGDAAHTMAPLQGQGANTAIQDAGALAAALAATGIDDPSPAFARYEHERVAQTREMQLSSRERGVPKPKAAAGF